MARYQSPYLKEPSRLSDVISAIQAMALYDEYKLSFEGWADRISADESRGGYWRKVFEEHPEFFRLDSGREKASLVWRRQSPKRYDTKEHRLLSAEEYARLPDGRRGTLSREPLAPGDIRTLIDSAINLHSRALEASKESRWWIPVVASFVGGILGAAVGALLKGTV